MIPGPQTYEFHEIAHVLESLARWRVHRCYTVKKGLDEYINKIKILKKRQKGGIGPNKTLTANAVVKILDVGDQIIDARSFG